MYVCTVVLRSIFPREIKLSGLPIDAGQMDSPKLGGSIASFRSAVVVRGQFVCSAAPGVRKVWGDALEVIGEL